MAGRPAQAIPNAPNRIREVRLSLDITQEEIGQAVGVTGEQVRKWEVGENDITIARLVQVARVLRVAPHTLLMDYDAPRGEEEEAALKILRLLPPADRERGLKMLRALLPSEPRRAAS